MLNDLKNAFRKPNNALTQIIIINVIGWIVINLVHVIAPTFYKSFSEFLFVSGPLDKLAYHPWTLLTYAFSHHELLHILFNMLALYWFGMLVSEYLNSKRLISLYVLGALAGSLSYVLIYNFYPGGSSMGNSMLGASGAVFAVVVGAATLMPNYSFHLIFIGPVRIKYIAALLVLLSIFQLRGMNAGGQIAHLGGALMGYLFIVSLNRGTDLGAWIHYVIDGFTGLFRKKSKMKVTYRKSKVTANAGTNYANANRNTMNSGDGTPDQAEIDAILDKISESGYESLSKEEKQQLFNASKKK